MKISSNIITIILVSVVYLKAQNSNLLLEYFSGGYIAMGGTGVAANNLISQSPL